ncbi:LuxR C-terminal-related transcriptional regulator [Nocardioides sp. GCM10028917]|uniref:LuxR C-terminal-related transcriptional regulator n=1 Tax=Nocardioides sp. GCM10028917 TaxID=3273408 RepID=UPI003606FF27
MRPPTQGRSLPELLAEGRDVRGISRELEISVHTCRGYVKSLLSNLDAHSQLEAVAVARTHGLIS